MGSGTGGPVELPPNWGTLVLLGREEARVSALVNLVHQILRRESGSRLWVLDLEGGLAGRLLDHLTPEAAAETIWTNPVANEWTTEGEGGEEGEGRERRAAVVLDALVHPSDGRDLTREEAMRRADRRTADLLDALQGLMEDDPELAELGPELVRETLWALETVPESNLWDLERVLRDRGARARLLSEVQDPSQRQRLKDQFDLARLEDGQDYGRRFASRLAALEEVPGLRALLGGRGRGRPERQGRVRLFDARRSHFGKAGARLLGSLVLATLDEEHRLAPPASPPFDLIIHGADPPLLPFVGAAIASSPEGRLRVLLSQPGRGDAPREPSRWFPAGTLVYLDLPREGEAPGGQGPDARAPPRRPGPSRPPEASYLIEGDRVTEFEPWPPLPPGPEAPGNAALVLRATRARSRWVGGGDLSPFLLEERTLRPLLRAFASGRRDERSLATRLRREPLYAGELCRFAERLGLLSRADGADRRHLSPHGRALLRALEAKRPGGGEGPTHSELLARFSEHLERHGLTMRPVAQRPGVPVADGEFTARGVHYHVEVEAAPVGRFSFQVGANLAKAVEEGRRCVFVVEDRPHAESLAASLLRRAPGARPDRQYAIMFAGPGGDFLRYPDGERGDPFLPPVGPSGGLPGPRSAGAPGYLPPPSDLDRVRSAAARLRSRGVVLARAEELIGAMPPPDAAVFLGDRGRLRWVKLGKAARAAGLRVRQEWQTEGRRKVRAYDLGPAGPPGAPAAPTAAPATRSERAAAPPAPPPGTRSPPGAPFPSELGLPPSRRELVRRAVGALAASGNLDAWDREVYAALSPDGRRVFTRAAGRENWMALGKVLASLGVVGRPGRDPRTGRRGTRYSLRVPTDGAGGGPSARGGPRAPGG